MEENGGGGGGACLQENSNILHSQECNHRHFRPNICKIALLNQMVILND